MRAAGVAVVSLALVGLVAVVGPAQGAYRGRNGVIVFERGGDLYTLRASDGRVLRRLTRNEGLNTSPTWSPDRKQIAFHSNRHGNYDIYVMNADGSGVTDLTSGRPGPDRNPSWSPDGKQIVYEQGASGSRQLYVMNADGSGVHRIVTAPGFDNSPGWSPDGKLIAYAHGTQLRTVRPDGSEMRTLAKSAGQPSWSPSGRRIVYTCGSHICSIGLAGKKRRQLTHGAAQDSAPACSPDGHLIVFLSDRAFLARGVQTADLYVMHADGTHLRRLTHDRVNNFAPDWQPLP